MFETMPHKAIFPLNIMISVYSKNGEIDKVLKLLKNPKAKEILSLGQMIIVLENQING